MATETKPKCERCGKGGNGILFNIFGPFEFGRYCVPCEKIVVSEREV
jgi:hypothetical protein